MVTYPVIPVMNDPDTTANNKVQILDSGFKVNSNNFMFDVLNFWDKSQTILVYFLKSEVDKKCTPDIKK